MFRGPSWDGLVSRFASLTKDPKTSGSRVPRPKDHLFRRLFPAGPGKLRGELSNCLPAEIGS